MYAFLQPVGGGEHVELDRPLTVIGRSPTCDVRLTAKTISRVHCCIVIDPDQTLVRDLDSRNGIRVNGTHVREQQLMVGDELAIGEEVFRFMCQSESDAEAREEKPKAQEPAATESPKSKSAPPQDDEPQLAPLSDDFEIPPPDEKA